MNEPQAFFVSVGSTTLGCLLLCISFVSILAAGFLAVQAAMLKAELQRQRSVEATLRYCSEYDTLSGLKNRNGFANYAAQLPWGAMTVLVCDLDNLKVINDTLGHLAGDELIRVAADLIRQACPPEAVSFRMGGDEFLILLPGHSRETGNKVYGKLKKIAEQHRKKQRLPLSLSVGIASATVHSEEEFTELLRQADGWMYREKRQHRECREELLHELTDMVKTEKDMQGR